MAEIKHPHAVGSAVRPVSSVTAAAPKANPDGVGVAAKIDERQSFVPSERIPERRLAGLHGQSVLHAEAQAAKAKRSRRKAAEPADD